MYSLDPGIRAEENLTDLPGAYDRAPGLSPDGRRIVFSSDRHDANGFEDYKNEYDLYSMNADGSGVRKVTEGLGEIQRHPRSPDRYCFPFGPVAFSLDREGFVTLRYDEAC